MRSAHDCSEGGLAFALLECCITSPGGALGAQIKLEAGGRLDTLLFGEAPSRIIVSAPPESRARLDHLARAAGVPIHLLGRVGGDRLSIAAGQTNVVDVEVSGARSAWRGALANHLKG